MEIKGKAQRTWERTANAAQAKLTKELGYEVTVDDAGDVIVGYNTDGEHTIGRIEFRGDEWVYIPNK